MNIALRLAAIPAALLATPAPAAVQLIGQGPIDSTVWHQGAVLTPSSRWTFGASGAETFAYSWLSPEWGMLVVSVDPATYTVTIQGGPARISLPSIDLAAILPEPIGWGMMVVGLAVVGWLLRDRHRHTLRHISFV